MPTHQLRAGDQTLTSPISPMHQPFPRARLAPPRYAQALVPSSLRSPPHEGALPPPRVPSPPIPPIRPPFMEQGISTDQLHQTIPRDRHRKKERKNGGEMEAIKRHEGVVIHTRRSCASAQRCTFHSNVRPLWDWNARLRLTSICIVYMASGIDSHGAFYYRRIPNAMKPRGRGYACCWC